MDATQLPVIRTMTAQQRSLTIAVLAVIVVLLVLHAMFSKEGMGNGEGGLLVAPKPTSNSSTGGNTPVWSAGGHDAGTHGPMSTHQSSVLPDASSSRAMLIGESDGTLDEAIRTHNLGSMCNPVTVAAAEEAKAGEHLGSIRPDTSVGSF